MGVEQGGLLQLIEQVDSEGGTVTFEFVGPQSRVGVRYRQEQLVLVAVRDRTTGDWWDWDRLEQLAAQWGVQLVRRLRELEGRTIRELQREVAGWVGFEGVVVQVGGGRAVKLKSRWWLQHKGGAKCRWHRDDRRTTMGVRLVKKQEMAETRQQRVVLRGWDPRVCPGLALVDFPAAIKVEALCRREDGRTGTLVLGFSSETEAGAVRGRQRVCGQEVWAEQAYSARCRSDRFRAVRTWWRQKSDDCELNVEGVRGDCELNLCKCQ